jgi:two-component sensor histidine kinase
MLRSALDPILPDRYPYLLSFAGILLCASLFNRGSGLLATGLSAAFAAYFYLPPSHSFEIEELPDLVGLALFAAVGAVMSLSIEALHKALADAQQAHAGLARSERARSLLLQEFHHRTRNDLTSLVGLLLLRARSAPSDAARAGLREAAEHAMALARIHTRLAPKVGLDENGAAFVDTREFIAGLCTDLETAQAGDGLRPVALIAEAEAHTLDAERAVHLGLVLNETITNSLKYAFPEDRAGTIRVCFRREGDQFVLTMADDGVGLPPEGDMDGGALPRHGTGLGTRLLRALAAQLRGSFTRRLGGCSTGTFAELRFPVETPGLLHR